MASTVPVTTLTAEQWRLLYLVSVYSKPSRKEGEKATWLRETPLRTLMYEGVTKGIFDWDYAPASVMTALGRQFMNISQEGEDDINDLREMGLLDALKLSTSRHAFITAYLVSEKGAAQLEQLSGADKKAVDGLIVCPRCKGRMVTEEQDDKILLRCSECREGGESGITDVEDVSYVSKAFIPAVGSRHS